MCTITIIPLTAAAGDASALPRPNTDADGFRLVCNRDEARARPRATPPRVTQHGSCSAVYPVDPVSQGTWIAATDSGLVLTLMNVHPPGWRDMRRDPTRGSRGAIIPALLDADGLEEAQLRLRRLRADAFLPFRLLILDDADWLDALSDGHRIESVRRARGVEPLMYSSSGLGDELVDAPRRRLFESMFSTPNLIAAQTAYHRSSWHSCPELSVCMRREDALTVSQTVVDRTPTQVRMQYHDGPPDGLAERFDLVLDRRMIRV